MNVSDYYQARSQACGIHTKDDILAQVRGESPLLRRIVRPWLPAARSAAIADLGCGYGRFLAWLKQEGYTRTIGIDGAFSQVELARSMGIDVREADVFTWLHEQPDNQYDAITAVDLIEHLSKEEFLRLMEMTACKLRPHGVLILRYPNGDSPWVGLHLFNDITHVWTYTTNCMTTLARLFGFHEVQFADEGAAAIRHNRWMKIPLLLLARCCLRACVRMSARETVRYWSPSIWACLRKTGDRV